jgi:hypothetical protein
MLKILVYIWTLFTKTYAEDFGLYLVSFKTFAFCESDKNGHNLVDIEISSIIFYISVIVILNMNCWRVFVSIYFLFSFIK